MARLNEIEAIPSSVDSSSATRTWPRAASRSASKTIPPDPVSVAIGPNYSLNEYETNHVIIKDDYLAAVEQAKSESKKLLVNFTGFT